jgi:uncharacterized zinc-type alcohol dehydrogenase-like protein
MTITAWQCAAPGAALRSIEFDDGAPVANEIDVDIDWCGLCHSDLHLLDGEWQAGQFPLIPGHEIIGRVHSAGSAVTALQVGGKVGIGWQCNSCGHCDECTSGHENTCAAHQATCIGRPGGFAERIRVSADFAFALPESLYQAAAAPLMCAGITVFAPLRRFGIGPGTHVAIAGYGGLGHLAVRFAVAMGAEVSVISASPRKREDALAEGATGFIDISDRAERKHYSRHFDLLLSTISADQSWPEYLALLKPRGTFCMVGVPSAPLVIPAIALVSAEKAMTGSRIGGRGDIRAMLDFAAGHGIVAQAEVLPIAEVNTAISRLRGGDVRHRMVLEMMHAG